MSGKNVCAKHDYRHNLKDWHGMGDSQLYPLNLIGTIKEK